MALRTTPIEQREIQSDVETTGSRAIASLRKYFIKELALEVTRRAELEKLERWNKGLPR